MLGFLAGKFFIYLLNFLFLNPFLQVRCHLPSSLPPEHSTSHPILPTSLPLQCYDDATPPPAHKASHSLGPQVSLGIGAFFFLTEVRPGSFLLYVSGPQISWCMLPCWWLCMRDLGNSSQLRLLIFWENQYP